MVVAEVQVNVPLQLLFLFFTKLTIKYVMCYILDRFYNIAGANLHELIMLTLCDALLCDCVICILNNMHISIVVWSTSVSYEPSWNAQRVRIDLSNNLF